MLRRLQRESISYIPTQNKSLRGMYCLPKTHKANVPLRPIVASRGSLTYNASSVLADIIGPLVGKSERHFKNSGYCVDKINNLEVPPVQKLLSYDVAALFPVIAVPPVSPIIRGYCPSYSYRQWWKCE